MEQHHCGNLKKMNRRNDSKINGRYSDVDKYKAIFENSPEAIVLMEKNGNVTDVNGRVFDWLGYKPEEIIGRNFRNLPFLPFSSKVKIAKNLIKRISGQNIPPYELFFIDISGKRRVGRISVSPIKNEKGKIQQVLALISDITRNKNAEKIIQEQQSQLKTIFSVSPDLLILIDQKFTYQAVNPAFCNYMNKQEAEIIGKTDFDLFPHEEAEVYRQSDIEVMKSGKLQTEERQAEGRDGVTRWFQVVKAPILNVEGTSTGILISIRDVTERKLAEERIKKLVNTLLQERNLFKKGPVVIFKWKNQKGWPVDNVSPNVKDVFGYSVEELTTGNIEYEDIIQEEDLERVSEEVKYNSKKGITSYAHKPYRIKRKDGKVIWVNDSTTIIRDDEGKVVQYQGYVFDISALKDAEEELIYHKKNLEELVLQRTKELEDANMMLIEAKNKAVESDNLKSAFLANMSHEIRTPMNIILGFGQLLKDENSEQIRQGYIENINKSGNHLLELINNIIDISKLEAGLVTIKKRSFSIDYELESLFKQFSGNEKCISKKVKLILDKPSSSKHNTIISDRFMIRQVMINLLNNALKFTNGGFVKFGYRTIENDDKSYFEFYVKDTGVGIPETDKKIIFDRFRQSNNTGKRLTGGTGLGLSICKANVSLLGGEIWLEPDTCKGSFFYFTIPGK